MNAYSQSLAPANTPLRETLSLDGTWEFRHETDRAWRRAKVPAHWQACFEDLSVSFGSATYCRTFALPAEWSAREIAIRFGAVSELATVSINGTEIGRHEGGYLPFEFVIPPALLKAENTVEVLACLPDAHRNESGADFAEIRMASRAGMARKAASGSPSSSRPAIPLTSHRFASTRFGRKQGSI